MIDYLKEGPEYLQVYAVQQTFQKEYHHQADDTFNTYFNLTNFSNCKDYTRAECQRVDHILVIDPNLFDSKIAMKCDFKEMLIKLEQSYTSENGNRIGIISLCSTDEEIQSCFSQRASDRLISLKEVSEDNEYPMLKTIRGSIGCIKSVIESVRVLKRNDTLLSLTLISSIEFNEHQRLDSEQIKQIVESSFRQEYLDKQCKQFLFHTMCIEQHNYPFHSAISSLLPQSLYYSATSYPELISSIQEIMNNTSRILMYDVQTTLTFSNTSPYLHIQVISFPHYWIQSQPNTYLFQYPFFYHQQDFTHLFKLKVKLKGNLSTDTAKEIFAVNRTTFTFNNQSYFYEKNIEFPLIKDKSKELEIENEEEKVKDENENQQKTENVQKEKNEQKEKKELMDLNGKCEQAFIKDKYLIPIFRIALNQIQKQEIEQLTLDKINKCIQFILASNVKSSFVIKYGYAILNILQIQFQDAIQSQINSQSSKTSPQSSQINSQSQLISSQSSQTNSYSSQTDKQSSYTNPQQSSAMKQSVKQKKKYVFKDRQLKQALFVLSNQLFTQEFYTNRKSIIYN